jgi:hypothetical protein
MVLPFHFQSKNKKFWKTRKILNGKSTVTGSSAQTHVFDIKFQMIVLNFSYAIFFAGLNYCRTYIWIMENIDDCMTYYRIVC